LSERFYFDLEDGQETISDEVGVEADSFEEAMDEARSVISEMADQLAADNPGETWLLVVRDADGSLLGRVPIKK
jgi:alanyl-tRNA synthetase